jgi:hypothetical protein
MKRFLQFVRSLFSSKVHKPDHAKNDTFFEQRTKDHKVKENKINRGGRFGKRWMPFNRD